jgi:hypothetical protein
MLRITLEARLIDVAELRLCGDKIKGYEKKGTAQWDGTASLLVFPF